MSMIIRRLGGATNPSKTTVYRGQGRIPTINPLIFDVDLLSIGDRSGLEATNPRNPVEGSKTK
jgi:hypothetical protein